MYAVIKMPCISNGPARFLEIIKTDEASWCKVPITAEKWPGNIETRGPNPALLCAHNLPFDRRSVDWRIKPTGGFSALYMNSGRELFSIVYNGKRALLKILDIDKAKNLYQELPQKLLPENYVFDPAAHQAEAKNINQANSDAKEREKERAEELEEYKQNSALYVKRGSSLGGDRCK